MPVRLEEEGLAILSKRVLVVDDDPTVRQLLTTALADLECRVEVTCAANGQEAIEILERSAVDLVLTDLQMPVKNGVELIRYLRSAHAGVPVVLLSGTSADWLEELVRDDLANVPLLTKPVSIAELLETIEPFLRT